MYLINVVQDCWFLTYTQDHTHTETEYQVKHVVGSIVFFYIHEAIDLYAY